MAKSNVVKLPTKNDRIIEVSGDVLPSGIDKNAKDVAKHRIAYSVKLDWSGVDMPTILRMAAQTVVIKLQGNVRSAYAASYDDRTKKHGKTFPDVVKEYMSGTINVQEKIVSKLRTTSSANRVEKIGNMVEKLTAEQKAALKKLLNVK